MTTESMEMQRVVFSRISALVRVCELHLTKPCGGATRTSDLRVGAVQELLEKLKKLQNLYFPSDDHEEMRVKEALWIAVHWLQSKNLGGPSSQDEKAREEMIAILNPREIRFHTAIYTMQVSKRKK